MVDILRICGDSLELSNTEQRSSIFFPLTPPTSDRNLALTLLFRQGQDLIRRAAALKDNQSSHPLKRLRSGEILDVTAINQ